MRAVGAAVRGFLDCLDQLMKAVIHKQPLSFICLSKLAVT
jgi:hypothetical protein